APSPRLSELYFWSNFVASLVDRAVLRPPEFSKAVLAKMVRGERPAFAVPATAGTAGRLGAGVFTQPRRKSTKLATKLATKLLRKQGSLGSGLADLLTTSAARQAVLGPYQLKGF
ncbi:MAG: hypothetical protein O2901_04730, partial [Verrucomicrobia bacterium]|nr:hypothetical protein [Verrucomicrobiota bacterium]